MNINSTFWYVWTVTNMLQGLDRRILSFCPQVIVLSLWKDSDGAFGWRNYTCIFWAIWVSVEIMMKNQKFWFSIQSSSTNVGFSNDTSM